MEILRANKKTTEEFTEKLQRIKGKYKVKQLDMRENLLKKSQDQLKKIRNNNDEENIGCPTNFCDELTKAKIEFDNVKIEQKKEEEQLIENYIQEILENMDIESVGKIVESTDSKCADFIKDENVQDITNEISIKIEPIEKKVVKKKKVVRKKKLT